MAQTQGEPTPGVSGLEAESPGHQTAATHISTWNLMKELALPEC